MPIAAAPDAEPSPDPYGNHVPEEDGTRLLAVIEPLGHTIAWLETLLDRLPEHSGIAWLLLIGSEHLTSGTLLVQLPLDVVQPGDGEPFQPDVVTLLADPSEISFERGHWRRRVQFSARSSLPSLASLPSDDVQIAHLLLGPGARVNGSSTGRAVREAGGICAWQDGGVIRVGRDDGATVDLLPGCFGSWLVQEWRQGALGSARSPSEGPPSSWSRLGGHFQPAREIIERLASHQGTSACLIGPDDRLQRLFGQHAFLLALRRKQAAVASLPQAMHVPVAETLRSTREAGSVQRLLHLPFDDPAGEIRFVDMVFVPLESPEIGRPHVLVVASPSRAMPPVLPDDIQPGAAASTESGCVMALASQLSASRLFLKAAVERLELGNEQLQAAYDDLKEAHGELEAYAADLKGVTEELYRIDCAHRQKITELEQLTGDIASLLNSIDVGVVFVDLDLRVRRCAPIAARMLRLEEPAEGRLLSEVMAGLGSEDLAPLISRTMADGRPGEIEIASWGVCRYLVRVLAHCDAQETITGAVVTLIDVTAYRAAEAGRAASEERWRRLVDTAPDAVIMHEAGKVTLINRSALRILATESSADLIGRSLMDLVVPEGRAALERQLARAAVEGIVADPAVTAIMTLTGRRVEVEITTSALSDDGRQAFQTVLRDVTDRRRAEAEIKRLVHHDGLTGLPNRTLLLDRLETAMARAARDGRHGALMLLDLDQFKDVNDTLGHPAGDRLLQIVARRLRSTLRSTDTLARLGGDEFAIVQTDLASTGGASGAATLAQKALDAIAEPITIDDHDLFITSSLGVTLFPTDANGADQLIKNADLALYRAKAEGGNRFQFFLEQMNAEVLQKKSLERELRRAIERGELSLAFQPQFPIAGGRPVGAEALLRWTHPERGSIPPKAFIPVAEATGLIRPLGRWVLEEACRAIRRGIDAGQEIGIGVNLSAAQLRHGDFVAHLHKLLLDTAIRPDLLEIEITESLLFEPSNDSIAEMLRRIAHMGVRLAVDDFGTSYSSLAYLKRFPVHKIKIDQSFVRDIGRDSDDDMIVAAMVNLAHSLGKRVIAEGVETERQLQFLRGLGCDEVQGYVLARPMPEAALQELLAGCG